MKVTVIMPAFNEEMTARIMIERVLDQRCVGQVIFVDDASSDDTYQIVSTIRDKRLVRINHEKNMGKGSAIRTASQHVACDIVLIQDADLEYNPKEYLKLIKPILENKADVVYGSRFQSSEARRILYFWHFVGNKFLTLLSNMFTDLNLSDMETCYKVIRADFFRNVKIQESRFGFEPEITGKLSALGARFYEVSITYDGRTYEDGKKIGAKDGFRAMWCILKYNKVSMKRRLVPGS